MNTSLVINPELRDLLPPLSPKQFAKLESEILKDGCTAPLVVWGNIIVDGHHRYTICMKHNVPFQTTPKTFESMDDAKLWMWQNQNSRRNLSRFQRAEIALKMKPIVANQANEKRLSTLKQNTERQNSASRTEPQKTRQILAEFAEVSHDTLDRVEFLLKHADAETLNRLRWDKKETSIHKEYTRLKAELDAQKPKTEKKSRSKSAASSKGTQGECDTKSTQSASSTAPKNASKTATAKAQENASAQATFPDTAKSGNPASEQASETVTVSLKSTPKVKDTYTCGIEFEPDPDDNFFDWITDAEREELNARRENCPNRLVPTIRNFTIQSIPEHSPEPLVQCLFSLFKRNYRKKLLLLLAREMRKEDSEEFTRPIITELYHEFH